jgi:two-component system cell cycle response regulator DivK
MAGARILVVESDGVLARVLTVLLQHWRFDVELARDSGEALSALGKALPAAIVTDVALSGLDGLQLTRALKLDPVTRAVPVIAIHAENAAQEQEAIAAGCAGCIGKPLDTHRLLALLRIVAPT